MGLSTTSIAPSRIASTVTSVVRKSAHENERRAGSLCPDRTDHVSSAHVSELEVHQQQVETISLRHPDRIAAGHARADANT
jgi:hypothetical protein